MNPISCLALLLVAALVSACGTPRSSLSSSKPFDARSPLNQAVRFSSVTDAILDSGNAADSGRESRTQAIQTATSLIETLAADLAREASPDPMPTDDLVLRTYQLSLQVISRNIANANTVGFRRSSVLFRETVEGPRLSIESDGPLPAASVSDIGRSPLPCTVRRHFTSGPVKQTGERLDVAIVGDGFFEIQMPDGTAGYTRVGALCLNANGEFITQNGWRIVGAQPVPAGTLSISISPGGTVSFEDTSGAWSMFELQLTRFMNPAGLAVIAENVFAATEASGTPEIGSPNSSGFGQLQQGYLELSNVDLAFELGELVRVHSAYEAYRAARQLIGAGPVAPGKKAPGRRASSAGDWIGASAQK